MTEPIKDSQEALEEFPPEEIPDGNGPDLDNGPEDEQEDVSSKLKTLYEKVIAAAEEYHRVFFQSQEWAILQKEFPGITKDQAMAISFIVDDIVDYMPELKEIIQEKEAEAGKPITISDLLEGIDLVNEETDTIGPFLLEDCLEAAQELRQTRTTRRKAGRKKKQPYNDPLEIKRGTYRPLLNASLTNGLMRLTARDFEPSKSGTTAYYTDSKGRKYTIDQFDKLMGNLDTSAKKILAAAILYLTGQNFFRGGINNINPTALIPFIDYGEVCGYSLTPRTMETKEEQEKENRRVNDRKKDLRKMIRRDLSDLEKIKGTVEQTRGDNAGEYAEVRIISSHRIVNDIIKVNFDIDFARHMVNAYQMQFPLILFRIDNRKPNTYAIGWKLALHNSMDSNFMKGTDCTLSVKTLLGAAPEIPTMEELADRGQRNWKDKIKRPLESSLNELISLYPLITKWEYRDTTGTRYNAEEAQGLTWDEYRRLVIDWTMKEQPPGQAERRAKRVQEKAEADSSADRKEARKRGRPRKKSN